jgi:hypothetical protein
MLGQPRQRLLRWIEGRHAGLVVVVLGVILPLPAVWSGFMSDDYFLLSVLDEKRIDAPPWYDLYFFFARPARELIARGILPWWSAQDFKLHLVRPLASALLVFDQAAFGDSAYGYHVHSLVWFAALLLLLRSFFTRVLGRSTGNLALFLFALSPCLTLPSRFIAARHLVVAAASAAAGLLLLLRGEERPRWRWYAAAAFALALLAGEAGLGGLAFWAAYELLGPWEGARQERLRRALGPVLLGFAYLIVYALAGGGTRHSDLYVDPLGDPLGFLRAAATRVPMLLGNAVWLVDAGFGMVWPVPIVIAGLLGAALVGALFARISSGIPSAEKAALRWLVPGALLATVGVVGGTPGGRELTMAGIGFAPLIAVILRYGWGRLRDNRAATLGLRRAAVALLAALHIVLGPAAGLAAWQFSRRGTQATETVARRMRDAAGGANRVVLLAASDPLVWVYALRQARSEQLSATPCWWIASAAKGEHRITRTGPRSFDIETTDATLLREVFERHFRAQRLDLAVGSEIEQCGAVIRVVAARDGLPYRLDVRLDVPLDDPDLVLLAWRKGNLERVAVSELSQGLSIPWSAGSMGF